MTASISSDRAPPPLSTINAIDEGTILEADSSRSDDATNASFDLATLTSSIVDYEFENGRRYHAFKAGHYPLPNDENELDRLDLQHHVITLLLNGEYYLAPLRKPSKILDIGTGTGLWAIEMGDKFPNAEITGVDLSPVQPTWVPDNVIFEIDDIESEWLWPENYYDHIHSRIMIGALGSWKEMIARSFTHCKPGGYLEIQELDPRLLSDDGSAARSPYHAELIGMIIEASEKYGKPVPHHSDFKTWMQEAGFVNVKSYLYKIPINSWPKDPRLKEVGKYQCLNYSEGYEGISIGLLTRVLGWTYVEFSVFMAKVRKELCNKSIHTYQSFVVAIGRKPYPHEITANQSASTNLEANTDNDAQEEQPFHEGVRHEPSYDPLTSDEGPLKKQRSERPFDLPPSAQYDDDAGLAAPYGFDPSHSGASNYSTSFSPEATEGYSITTATGRPNDFPPRPKPRNEY